MSSLNSKNYLPQGNFDLLSQSNKKYLIIFFIFAALPFGDFFETTTPLSVTSEASTLIPLDNSRNLEITFDSSIDSQNTTLNNTSFPTWSQKINIKFPLNNFENDWIIQWVFIILFICSFLLNLILLIQKYSCKRSIPLPVNNDPTSKVETEV